MTAGWSRRHLLAASGAGALCGFAQSPLPLVEPFGHTADGRPIGKAELVNARGTRVILTEMGAAVVGLETPDREGRFADVVLGLDDGAAYEANDASLGATVGRYANRIAEGRFQLDGRTIELSRNLGPHTLHGGTRGFSKALWRAEPFSDLSGRGVRFHLVSPDGDQGFPGALSVVTTYQLTADDRLLVSYAASTDRPTVLNLTNHAYFNLSGRLETSIEDHSLSIFASRYTPTLSGIPTGEVRTVAGTPLDFLTPRRIGNVLTCDDPLITASSGLDHNLILDEGDGGELRRLARLHHPGSGRTLEMWSTEPAVQVYSANFLRGLHGKGVDYRPRMGLCLEPQHYPDSPNQPAFPSTRLDPGHTFSSRTEWRFSAETA